MRTGVHSDPGEEEMNLYVFCTTFAQLSPQDIVSWFHEWTRSHRDSEYWQSWAVLHANREAQPYTRARQHNPRSLKVLNTQMPFQCDKCGLWLAHVVEFEVHIRHLGPAIGGACLTGCDVIQLLLDECWQNNLPSIPQFIVARLAIPHTFLHTQEFAISPIRCGLCGQWIVNEAHFFWHATRPYLCHRMHINVDCNSGTQRVRSDFGLAKYTHRALPLMRWRKTLYLIALKRAFSLRNHKALLELQGKQLPSVIVEGVSQFLVSKKIEQVVTQNKIARKLAVWANLPRGSNYLKAFTL